MEKVFIINAAITRLMMLTSALQVNVQQQLAAHYLLSVINLFVFFKNW